MVIVASFLFYFAFNTCNASVIYNTIVVVGATEAIRLLCIGRHHCGSYPVRTQSESWLLCLIKNGSLYTFMAIAGFALVNIQICGLPQHHGPGYPVSGMAHFAIIGFLVLSYNLLYDVCEVMSLRQGDAHRGHDFLLLIFIKLARQPRSRQWESFWTMGGYDASLTIQPDSAKAAVTNMASIIPDA